MHQKHLCFCCNKLNNIDESEAGTRGIPVLLIQIIQCSPVSFKWKKQSENSERADTPTATNWDPGASRKLLSWMHRGNFHLMAAQDQSQHNRRMRKHRGGSVTSTQTTWLDSGTCERMAATWYTQSEKWPAAADSMLLCVLGWPVQWMSSEAQNV